MIQNFGYVSSVSWGVVGFVNLWIAIVLSKSRLFATSKNTIHAVEAFLVWGTAFVLAVGPYWLEGESAYYNPLLCYSCSTIRNSLLYNLFLVLPQQVNIAVGGLCAVHLVYTLKKQVRTSMDNGCIEQQSKQRCTLVYTKFTEEFVLLPL